MSKGWISIHREIQEHWLWQEKRVFSKLEAWFDILLTVNHSEQKVMIKNTLYVVKRGDSIKCLETWGKRWNWNKSKVRRFLSLLKKDGMIELKNETKTTRLTVCKYDSYQDNGNANETQVKRIRNADETQMTPNNNTNNTNNTNKDNNVSVIVNDILLEKETKDLFNTWIDYRKELKKPYKTEKSILAVAKKIKENGYEISKKVINSSIENGYQGLFWDKFKQTKTNNSQTVHSNRG